MFSLASTVENRNCSVRENYETRILKNTQIILNARERNTKHTAKGTLIDLNRGLKVLNSTSGPLSARLFTKLVTQMRPEQYHQRPSSFLSAPTFV